MPVTSAAYVVVGHCHSEAERTSLRVPDVSAEAWSKMASVPSSGSGVLDRCMLAASPSGLLAPEVAAGYKSPPGGPFQSTCTPLPSASPLPEGSNASSSSESARDSAQELKSEGEMLRMVVPSRLPRPDAGPTMTSDTAARETGSCFEVS